MGILDLHIHPPDLRVKEQPVDKTYVDRLLKGKSEVKQYHCIHETEYEKWVIYFQNGTKHFIYKEVCRKCGWRKSVKRTKEVYEAVKDQKWHHAKSKALKRLERLAKKNPPVPQEGSRTLL